MNELELMTKIRLLEEAISEGKVFLAKLEAKQKELVKPEFPFRFFAAKDDTFPGEFVIGLSKSTPGLYSYRELPKDFVGRAPFTRQEIQQIIMGLQTLLGESNG